MIVKIVEIRIVLKIRILKNWGVKLLNFGIKKFEMINWLFVINDVVIIVLMILKIGCCLGLFVSVVCFVLVIVCCIEYLILWIIRIRINNGKWIFLLIFFNVRRKINDKVVIMFLIIKIGWYLLNFVLVLLIIILIVGLIKLLKIWI